MHTGLVSCSELWYALESQLGPTSLPCCFRWNSLYRFWTFQGCCVITVKEAVLAVPLGIISDLFPLLSAKHHGSFHLSGPSRFHTVFRSSTRTSLLQGSVVWAELLFSARACSPIQIEQRGVITVADEHLRVTWFWRNLCRASAALPESQPRQAEA